MTLIDWMFAHPWMTFFICLAICSAIQSSIKYITKYQGKEDSEDSDVKIKIG